MSERDSERRRDDKLTDWQTTVWKYSSQVKPAFLRCFHRCHTSMPYVTCILFTFVGKKVTLICCRRYLSESCDTHHKSTPWLWLFLGYLRLCNTPFQSLLWCRSPRWVWLLWRGCWSAATCPRARHFDIAGNIFVFPIRTKLRNIL